MKRLISVLCSVVAAVSVMAQNVGDEGTTLTPNRLGLVYENAISENVAGRVNIHRVNYQVEGIGVVANVYTPAGYDPKKSYAAVVVAHHDSGIAGRTVCGCPCYGTDRGAERHADPDAADKADERSAVDHSCLCFRKGFRFAVLLSDRWILCFVR